MADRISELPDTVLCHILSYLPTTDAIATSVLSKSWKIVWRSCPSLRFDDFRYVYPHSRPYSPFIQSIHMALLLRDCHQTIQSFSLTCRFYHCDSTNVSIWIQSAVYRGVQNLDLCVINLFKLPTLVFTCKTLVVLKLNHFYIRDVTTVHLPQLKTMHLTNLTFSQHGHFAQLICASPNLEELVAVNSTFHSRADKGSFKNLPKLVRATVAKKDVPLVVVSNVRYLHLDWMDDESVNIDPIREVNVFRNLIHLECSYMHYIRDWGKVVKVLKLCPKLQVFLIDKMYFDSLIQGDEVRDCWAYPESVPKAISLQLKICSLHDYKGCEGELRFAEYIMRNAGRLQTMSIRCNPYRQLGQRFEMLTELSLCTRRSASCKLIFR